MNTPRERRKKIVNYLCSIGNKINSALNEALSKIIYYEFENVHKSIMQERKEISAKPIHFEYKSVRDIMEDYELTFAEACEVVREVMEDAEIEGEVDEVLGLAIDNIAYSKKKGRGI